MALIKFFVELWYIVFVYYWWLEYFDGKYDIDLIKKVDSGMIYVFVL